MDLYLRNLKNLGEVAENERKKFASNLNVVKDELQNLITKKIQEIESKRNKSKIRKRKSRYNFT